MRMWMVDPSLLCRRHLLGEHVETHMFLGTIKRGTSLGGYVSKGLFQSRSLKDRHDALAAEMTKRGMRHNSPLDYTDHLHIGNVDVNVSLAELKHRCVECRDRIVSKENENS